MLAHVFDQLPPELRAALLVDSFVSDDGKFLRARDDQDENGVALGRLIHPEFEEFLLRQRQGFAGKLPSLNENANLA